MDFFTAIKTCFSKYADFTGRARRSEFWFWSLFTFIVVVLLSCIPVIGWILLPIAGIAFIIPSLAVGARRLHDTGKSGWWWLINLIPTVGTIILIVFWVQDSHAGKNQYGANPKA